MTKKTQFWLYFIVFLFALSSNLGFCQYYDITTKAVNNNNYSATLPKKLLLDKQGFLWYSTFNGIVKDMGNHTTFFEYDKISNLNKAVYLTRDLLLTSDNKIFACTQRGLKIIDVNTSKTEWIAPTYPNTNIKVDFTSAMEDKDGNVWLGTRKSYLYCFTKDKKLIYTEIKASADLKMEAFGANSFMIIEAILKDGSVLIKQSGEWFRVKDNLSYYLFNSKLLFPDYDAHEMNSIPNGYIVDKNSSGRIKALGEDYYYTYVPEIDLQIVQIRDPQLVFVPNIYHKNMSKPIDFVFYLNDVLTTASLTKKETGFYTLDQLDEFVFDKQINDVIIDPRGYILAQSQKGISKIQYKNSGFQVFFKDYKNYGVDSNISCRAPVEDSKGNIFIYTYSGFFKKEVDTSDFKKMIFNSDGEAQDDFGIPIYNIYMLDDDHLLAFGYSNHVIKLNVKTGASKVIKITESESMVVFDADKFKDNVLLATSKGIFEYNVASNSIDKFQMGNSPIKTSETGIYDILFSEKTNTIWAASRGSGLYRCNLNTNQVDVLTNTTETLELLNNDISVVYEDSDFNIWIGTSKGAQKINPKTLQSSSFTTLNGLINDHVSGIQESENHMWLATFEGLVKINKKTDGIQLYTEHDGLSDNEINFKSELRDRHGNLYFGGIDGLVKFDPEVVTQKSQKYDLFLTEYEKFEKRSNETELTYNALGTTPDFTIPYYKNYITLTFAINDIEEPEYNKYQYRIKKLGDDWVNLGNYNSIQLIGLQPDDYTLEVRGFSSNGQATNVLTYNLKIQKVFYKNSWFIALVVLLLLSFITWFNYYRRQKLKITYDQKNKIQELESKALRAQMNPHFIFNTLNGMQSVMLLKGEREANKYFTAFSKLIRLTLDMSNSEYILLKNEIKYIESYLSLEKIRHNDRLTTELYIDPEFNLEKDCIPCMLFQPVIENALIHGLTPKKDDDLQLKISFKKRKNMLIAEIIDNGIGREAAGKMKERSRKEHKSWATHIMKERISISNALSNQKIEFDIIDLIEDSLPIGTKVIMKIPIKMVKN